MNEQQYIGVSYTCGSTWDQGTILCMSSSYRKYSDYNNGIRWQDKNKKSVKKAKYLSLDKKDLVRTVEIANVV